MKNSVTPHLKMLHKILVRQSEKPLASAWIAEASRANRNVVQLRHIPDLGIIQIHIHSQKSIISASYFSESHVGVVIV